MNRPCVKLITRYMGTVQTNISITSHQISCFRGTDGEGGRNQKNIKTLSRFSWLHLTYVGCPERAPPPGIRSRTIYPDAHVASTWFLNILRYVDKCEEGRVTIRTVPDAIIVNDTQPRTPNQSSMVNNHRYVQWWLFGYIWTWRWQAT